MAITKNQTSAATTSARRPTIVPVIPITYAQRRRKITEPASPAPVSDATEPEIPIQQEQSRQVTSRKASSSTTAPVDTPPDTGSCDDVASATKISSLASSIVSPREEVPDDKDGKSFSKNANIC